MNGPRRGDGAGSGRACDRGSGVVLLLGVVAATMTVGLLVAGAGGAVVARHRAEAAADLAALAAAQGDPVPDCSRAQAVAAGSLGRLTGCAALPDGSVLVEVVEPLPGWMEPLTGGRGAVARARAGHPGDATGTDP